MKVQNPLGFLSSSKGCYVRFVEVHKANYCNHVECARVRSYKQTIQYTLFDTNDHTHSSFEATTFTTAYR